jgi:hypothetical protein
MQCSKDFQERLEKWLYWAKRHSDRIDPIKKGLPFEKDYPE